MTKTNPKPKTIYPQSDNFVESLRDLGSSTYDSFKNDLLTETPKSFVRQLLGVEKAPINASGEIKMGQSIEMEKVLEAERGENKVLREQLHRERQLKQEGEAYNQKETDKLRLQLKALQGEAEKIAKEIVGLSQETKIATIQATVSPGVYHLIFFEKLLSFLKSFRLKIHQANLWLQSQNKRSSKKKTFWGQVGKSGAQRLLSGEDYSQRSAG